MPQDGHLNSVPTTVTLPSYMTGTVWTDRRTDRALPQAVRRTEFPAAAMFGTFSLRPQEPSPLPWVYLPSPTAKKKSKYVVGPLGDKIPTRLVSSQYVISSEGESRTGAARGGRLTYG